MHTLENIRILLLAQHERLRRSIEKVQQLVALWSKKDHPRKELEVCLRNLADELASHNKCEEDLLGDVIPTIDAWGPLRAEAMLEAHTAEHQQLVFELSAAAAETDAETGAARILAMLDALLGHMDHEERTFLDENLLVEGLAARDSFGG
jgi:iron-sulfur cluster repair protein YtfE (RIC family)